MTNDPWAWWKAAIAGKEQPIHDGDPNAGYYRLRTKNKQTGSISWRPVAYYVQNGKMLCVIGNEPVSADRGAEIWSYVCRSPVTEEAYREVAERNGTWPDQDSIVASQTTPGIGDNTGTVDEIEVLTDQIKAAANGKGKYLKIANQQQSEQAQSLRSRLLELAGQATKAKKKKADPLYKEWKEVNAKWNPIIEEAEGAAAAIKAANDRWLTDQLNAAKAATAAADASDMMEPAEAMPVVPTQIKGGYGRAAHVGTKWIVKTITDYDALYQHFKNSAAVKEALEKLAKAGVKDGEVPGVEREEVASTK